MWPTLFKLPWIHLPVRGYGLMLMIGFLGGTWWAARRAVRVKADPDFVVNLGFVSLIASVVGARILYVTHYWHKHFAGRGLWAIVDVSAGGLEYYGGLVGALVAGLAYVRLKGNSTRLYLDIVAPSLMFGMGVARIGCFLNGCCWGGPCPPEIPWAVHFPYASPAFHRQWEERLVTVPAELIYVSPSGIPCPIPRDLLEMTPEERDASRLALEKARAALKEAQAAGADSNTLDRLRKKGQDASKRRTKMAGLLAPFARQAADFDLTPSELEQLAHASQNRSNPIHPVQLYASTDGLLLAVLLNAYFYRRKRHGMVFAMLLLFYPIVRIVEEIIRIDNPYDTAGLTVSQFVSVALFAAGLAYIYLLRRSPPRSPRAVPYVAPPPEPEQKKKKKRS